MPLFALKVTSLFSNLFLPQPTSRVELGGVSVDAMRIPFTAVDKNSQFD